MIDYVSRSMPKPAKERFLLAVPDNLNDLNHFLDHLTTLVLLDHSWLNFIKVLHLFFLFHLSRLLFMSTGLALSRLVLSGDRSWLAFLWNFRSSMLSFLCFTICIVGRIFLNRQLWLSSHMFFLPVCLVLFQVLSALKRLIGLDFVGILLISIFIWPLFTLVIIDILFMSVNIIFLINLLFVFILRHLFLDLSICQRNLSISVGLMQTLRWLFDLLFSVDLLNRI